MHLAVDGHLALLHRLEEGGLGTRRGAVDLVREQDVREDGAGEEDVLSGADHVLPLSSLGVVSGVNWMRLNDAPSMCAIARASSVFALPGGPSMST